ncbi:MAG: hypothetical protein Tsb0020_21510 [Haliangiales bacterium]
MVLAGLGLGAWWAAGALFSDSASNTGVEHVVNQVWIDHFPTDARDTIGHLVLFDDGRERIGVTGRSSQWRHHIELFKWRLEGDRLAVFFPQERMRERVTVRSWSCAGDAPAPFELCLEVKNRRGDAVVLYSREDWAISADPDKLVEGDLATLADSSSLELAVLAGELRAQAIGAAVAGGEGVDALDADEMFDVADVDDVADADGLLTTLGWTGASGDSGGTHDRQNSTKSPQ